MQRSLNILFPFTHECAVGGACIAEMECRAIIEADPYDPDEWTVSGIEALEITGVIEPGGRRIERWVQVPDEHALYDGMLARVLNRRAEIDREWDAANRNVVRLRVAG